MGTEARRVTNTEAWTQWESQVINGVFPLRRCLGSSNHSAVFLTEYKAKNLADAAIKFVPADALQAEAQLVQWRAAATLSHPHLTRLFDVGRCQFEGRDFLFVVMEYAEQTLAQILARRALSPEEVREMLLPTLDALAFLHRKHLVHGRLQPSNLLAVDDQLKLAGDTVRPIGNYASVIVRTSSYDPPELQDRGISTAGDIWALGMTLIEALTQRTAAWSDEQCETASLPASFPAPFVDTVRRCLDLTPANRPTITELEAQYNPAPPAHSIPDPQPPAYEAPREATAPPSSPKRHLLLPAIAAALLISLAVWAGLHFSGTSPAPSQPPAVPAPAPVAPATIAKSAQSAQSAKSAKSNSGGLPSPVARPPSRPALPAAATSPSVLHEVIPDVPRAIREKIKGHVRVTVRVLVDPAGNVVGKLVESPGPSKYFARLADHAAGEWQFVPADRQSARVWLLRFDFSRGGVSARAIAQ
jgi:serine/threonine protein kinase